MRRIDEAAALTLFSVPHIEMEAAIAPSSGVCEAWLTISSGGWIGAGSGAGVGSSDGLTGLTSAGGTNSAGLGAGVRSRSG